MEDLEACIEVLTVPDKTYLHSACYELIKSSRKLKKCIISDLNIEEFQKEYNTCISNSISSTKTLNEYYSDSIIFYEVNGDIDVTERLRCFRCMKIFFITEDQVVIFIPTYDLFFVLNPSSNVAKLLTSFQEFKDYVLLMLQNKPYSILTIFNG